jgi:hypothetical protein
VRAGDIGGETLLCSTHPKTAIKKISGLHERSCSQHSIASTRLSNTLHSAEMAARRAPRALCSSISQLAKPSVAGRAFTPLLAARAAGPVAKRFAGVPFQQTRGIKTIDFAGTKESVYGMFNLFARRYAANAS